MLPSFGVWCVWFSSLVCRFGYSCLLLCMVFVVDVCWCGILWVAQYVFLDGLWSRFRCNCGLCVLPMRLPGFVLFGCVVFTGALIEGLWCAQCFCGLDYTCLTVWFCFDGFGCSVCTLCFWDVILLCLFLRVVMMCVSGWLVLFGCLRGVGLIMLVCVFDLFLLVVNL